MSKHTYLNQRRRRVDYKRIAIAFFALTLVSTAVVGVRSYTLGKNIKETQVAKEETQNQINDIQKKIDTLKEENTMKSGKIKSIEELLWRYEPVIIPNSMK